MIHASLFSGIGGFDLAAEWMGWTNLFNCEWEEFPRQVLKYHFPHTKQYGDVRELDATIYDGRIDVLTGGFPCQPYSYAGERKGKNDERHLWPEMLRVIRECSPRWIVGENVRGIVSWNGGLVFEEVCADLEASGYSVQPFILPAAGVGAPHRRERIWFVAYRDEPNKGENGGGVQRSSGEVWWAEEGVVSRSPSGNPIVANSNHKEYERWSGTGERERQEGEQGRDGVERTTPRPSQESDATDTHGLRLEHGTESRSPSGSQGEIREHFTRHFASTGWSGFPTFPPVCGGDDGLPRKLDDITFSRWRRESIKAYGNAIVPQVALQIFKAIEQYAQYPEA